MENPFDASSPLPCPSPPPSLSLRIKTRANHIHERLRRSVNLICSDVITIPSRPDFVERSRNELIVSRNSLIVSRAKRKAARVIAIMQLARWLAARCLCALGHRRSFLEKI